MENLINSNLVLEEKDLTLKSMNRMKWIVVLAAPGLPLMTGIYLWASHRELAGLPDLSDLSKGIVASLTVLAMLSIVCFICVCMNKKFSTIFQSSKSLDEWGLAHKQRAEAFAHRMMGLIILSGVGVLGLIKKFFGQITIGMFDSTLVVLLVLNFVTIWVLLPAAHIAWSVKALDETDD